MLAPRIPLAGALLLALTLAAPAAAQPAAPSAALLDAARRHVLTEANAEPVIEALRELSAAMVADPDVAKASRARMKLPPDQQARELEIDPMASRVLKRAGLSGHDYMLALVALRAAAGVPPDSPLASAISPANVAFLQAHPDVLARFRAAERGQ